MALETWGDDARSNDAGFEQAEVIVAEVEEFLKGVDFLFVTKVDRNDADDGAIDDPAVALDGRDGIAVTVDGEVDGDVDDAGAFGVVHAEEEDVGPAGVAGVSTHRRAIHAEGIESGGGVALKVDVGDTERVAADGARTEHPFVAATGTDTLANLIHEVLEGEGIVGFGEGAEESFVAALGHHGGAEAFNSIVVLAVKHGADAGIRDVAFFADVAAIDEVVAIDSVNEEASTDAVVEII